MACYQFGANSAFELMITYRELDPQEITLWHFSHIFQNIKLNDNHIVQA